MLRYVVLSKVIVIGGGAAGMMAAYAAGLCGHAVTLYEKNEKLGKKIYITGKGRCNFTNAVDVDEFLKHVVSNEKFLYSALYTLDPDGVMAFMEQWGTSIKVERGNRAFPQSDHASDVTKALKNAMDSVGVKVYLNTCVKDILVADNKACGVLLENGKKEHSDAVILATGGLSYPTTGSTGDGYRFAERLQIKVAPLYPALVPFEVKEKDVLELQGISLKNVSVKVCDDKNIYFEDFGEMLFTHFGISGPLVLSASSKVTSILSHNPLHFFIDFKPALSYDKLDDKLLRMISENPKKKVSFVLGDMLPKKVASVLEERLDIPEEKNLSDLTKEERHKIILGLKEFHLTLTKTRGFKEAIVTQGGISVKEVNPSTMEAKNLPGLFICGEVLDVDAFTGGFNLQIAFSTGYLAGISVN